MFASGLFLLILLALFGRQMAPDWDYSVQYSYGWIVLPCALYLAYLRWQDRPATAKSGQSFPLLLAAILLFILAPLRLVQEANPDWRLISWSLGLIVCGLALILVYRTGGKPWLKHFSFPCLFLLVAIPWPTWLEQGLIQELTRIVTSITVEGLNLAGIPALQHGNLIELDQTWIGVNEACSGVRSFQATLMVALFLGEMFRFSWKQRAGFIGAGLALALAGNIFRAFLLSWIAANGGGASMEKWHDPAGFSILAAVFILLLIATFKMDGAVRKSSPTPAVSSPSSSRNPMLLSWPICAGALLWLALAEMGTEVWYRSHEQGAPPASTWSLQLPQDNSSLITDSLPADAHSLLRYDEGYKAAWDDEGSRWSTIFLRWKPGRNAAQLAHSHAPEVCLSATGMQFVKDYGTREMTAQGLSFHFRMLEFASSSGPLYVFYLLWEDRKLATNQVNGAEDYSSRSRWEAVLAGRRHLGQRLLEVAISRAPSPEEATRRLTEKLPGLVKIDPR